MDQTKSIKLQKKRLESADERRARLDKANERARAKRRMETEEQKKEARKKECKGQGQTNITNDGRQKIRLEKKEVTLANESCELWIKQRVLLQKKRLESAEERSARLDNANERARAKRRMETEEQKKMGL